MTRHGGMMKTIVAFIFLVFWALPAVASTPLTVLMENNGTTNATKGQVVAHGEANASFVVADGNASDVVGVLQSACLTNQTCQVAVSGEAWVKLDSHSGITAGDMVVMGRASGTANATVNGSVPYLGGRAFLGHALRNEANTATATRVMLNPHPDLNVVYAWNAYNGTIRHGNVVRLGNCSYFNATSTADPYVTLADASGTRADGIAVGDCAENALCSVLSNGIAEVLLLADTNSTDVGNAVFMGDADGRANATETRVTGWNATIGVMLDSVSLNANQTVGNRTFKVLLRMGVAHPW